MDKLVVDNELFELLPEVQVITLEYTGLDNHVDESKDPYYEKLLADAAKEARKFIDEETFSQSDVVAQWRQTFQKFKTKKGARSSIEALLKRVSQNREFSPINPLVDIYNSVSLKYGVPCGGEDTDKLAGNLHLGLAEGGEQFLPLGATEDAPALPGEVIYYDDKGAVCRCFNWREAQRTMLTEDTTNAILVIESVNEEQSKRAQLAMEEIQKLIQENLHQTGVMKKFSK